MMPIEKAIPNNIFFQPPDFSCQTFAKCILAGEHSVLVGYPAAATSLSSRFLKLDYWRTPNALSFKVEGPNVDLAQLRLTDFIDYLGTCINFPSSKISGTFHLQFNMPLASGLGTSACIAVAFARWCLFQGLIEEAHLFETAHNLENFFHGTSSGLDVAAVLYGFPLLYQKSKAPLKLEVNWHPYLYLTFTGITSNTAEAVNHANMARRIEPHENKNIDLEMARSVELFTQGLSTGSNQGLQLLKSAIEKAQQCFQAWGLVNHPEVENHIRILKHHGALAVKMTGAGKGGYVLSLWEQPPHGLPFETVAVF